MDEGIKVSVRKSGDVGIIDLEGDVTTFAEESVKKAYEDATKEGLKNLVLNFSKVEYVNSAGIAIVLGILVQARKNKQRLNIFGLTPHFQKMFQIVGIHQYAKLCQTEDEATKAF